MAGRSFCRTAERVRIADAGRVTMSEENESGPAADADGQPAGEVVALSGPVFEIQSTRQGRGGHRPGAGRKPGKRSAATVEIEALARKHATKAIKALVAACTQETNLGARVSAAQSLLDRGFGRPRQAINIVSNVDLTTLSDEEFDKLAAQVLQLNRN